MFEFGEVVFDGVADDGQIDVGVTVRDAIAGRPNDLPVVSDVLLAKLATCFRDGVDGGCQTEADGIGDDFIGEVASGEVSFEYVDVIERIVHEFDIGRFIAARPHSAFVWRGICGGLWRAQYPLWPRAAHSVRVPTVPVT